MNIIWEVKKPASSGIWRSVKFRLLSFGLILSIAFILNVSLLLSALLSAFGSWLAARFSPAFYMALRIANDLLSLAVITALFALLFKFVPDAKVAWRDVWLGAFITALLFSLGKFGLTLYFSSANPATGYGAAGSLVLLMVWIYYSAAIVFLGAEFTHVIAGARAERFKGEKAG